jgi:hypothetical protein
VILASGTPLTDMVAQTQGMICHKDKDVIDEIPGAYEGHRSAHGQSG